jgi:limonene-1,2-epoxide hydrolase
MKPKDILQKWVNLFNQGNANEIAELYHDDAVNHQVVNEPIEGKENIRKMFLEEFSKFKMICIVENIFEDGEWAILEWKDPLGLRGCGFFQIIDDKIIFQRGYWDKLTFIEQNNNDIRPTPRITGQ